MKQVLMWNLEVNTWKQIVANFLSIRIRSGDEKHDFLQCVNILHLRIFCILFYIFAFVHFCILYIKAPLFPRKKLVSWKMSLALTVSTFLNFAETFFISRQYQSGAQGLLVLRLGVRPLVVRTCQVLWPQRSWIWIYRLCIGKSIGLRRSSFRLVL